MFACRCPLPCVAALPSKRRDPRSETTGLACPRKGTKSPVQEKGRSPRVSSGLGWGILLPEGGMHMRPKRHRDMTEAIIRQQQQKNPWDVLGSWTGVPWDEDETPVQDADDL